MKPLELIWFENVSSFTEPVLGLGPIRASLKQFLYTLIGLALAFALMQLSLLLIPLAVLMIGLAYLRPYGQDLETLLIDMVGFLFRKKNIGEVVGEGEDKKKDKKVKDKDKKDNDKVKVTAEVAESISNPATSTIPATPTEPISIPAPTPNPTTTIPTTSTKQKNLLHYIVPSTKDFDLEITEKEYVIATGESTIHIEHEQKDAIILITIRNGTVTDILVNRQ